jgi:hypothetical protein
VNWFPGATSLSNVRDLATWLSSWFKILLSFGKAAGVDGLSSLLPTNQTCSFLGPRNRFSETLVGHGPFLDCWQLQTIPFLLRAANFSPCTVNSSELKSAIGAARTTTVVSNVYCEQYIRSCQSNGPKQCFKI